MFEFFTQRVAIDTEHVGSTCLVAIDFIHDHLEKWFLNFIDKKGVQIGRKLAIEIIKVLFHGVLYTHGQGVVLGHDCIKESVKWSREESGGMVKLRKR